MRPPAKRGQTQRKCEQYLDVLTVHLHSRNIPYKDQGFDLWRGNMQKGALSYDNAPFARLFSCNLFARCP